MSERLQTFLDEVLQRYFEADSSSAPHLRQGDVETLLADDAQWRVAHVRAAAVEWGRSEIPAGAQITAERWVVTPRGLLYAAALRAPSAPGTLYYLATPAALFDPLADRAHSADLDRASAAAVDGRLDSDLTFPWPLDAALRRLLDAQEVLRLELIQH